MNAPYQRLSAAKLPMNGVSPVKKYPSDHDGKSKTASAVDQDHYPEQHEVENLDPKDQGKSDSEDQNKSKSGGSVQH
jgi:hypothetical protein